MNGESLASSQSIFFGLFFTVTAVMGPCRLGTPRPSSPESYSYSSKLSQEVQPFLWTDGHPLVKSQFQQHHIPMSYCKESKDGDHVHPCTVTIWGWVNTWYRKIGWLNTTFSTTLQITVSILVLQPCNNVMTYVTSDRQLMWCDLYHICIITSCTRLNSMNHFLDLSASFKREESPYYTIHLGSSSTYKELTLWKQASLD